MSVGGARNRSGPQPDPGSARSARRGLTFRALPAEGFGGRVPAFPLPSASVRERKVWRELWRTPQAAAWVSEPWRWRSVALFARWSVRMEEPDAPSSVATAARQLADEIGLTTAGLRANGWTIEANEPARGAEASARSAPAAVSSKNRLSVVKHVG